MKSMKKSEKKDDAIIVINPLAGLKKGKKMTEKRHQEVERKFTEITTKLEDERKVIEANMLLESMQIEITGLNV